MWEGVQVKATSVRNVHYREVLRVNPVLDDAQITVALRLCHFRHNLANAILAVGQAEQRVRAGVLEVSSIFVIRIDTVEGVVRG
jgi:hypothetical protein